MQKEFKNLSVKRKENEYLTTNILIPLSNEQKRYWFYQKIDPEGLICNIPAILKLENELNVKVLKKSLYFIYLRHQSLRTQIVVHNDQLFQKTQPLEKFKFFEIDLSIIPANIQQKEFELITRSFHLRKFDLEHDTLAKAIIVRFDKNTYYLVLSFHHCVIDGWSFNVFLTELKSLYLHFSQQAPPPYPIKFTYYDYILKQNSYLSSTKFNDDMAFWKKNFDIFSPQPVYFLIDSPTKQKKITDYKGKMYFFSFSVDDSNKIRAMCSLYSITPHMLFLTIYALLIYAYTDEKTFFIGTPYGNRHSEDEEKLIGLLQNYILIKFNLHNNLSLQQLFINTRKNVLQTLKHAKVPYNILIEQLDLKKTRETNSLTNIMYICNNANISDTKLGNLNVSIKLAELGFVNADLTLVIFNENKEKIFGRFECRNSIFTTWQAHNLVNTFKNLLTNILYYNPNTSIYNITYYPLTDHSTKNYFFGKKTKIPYLNFNNLLSNQILNTHETAIIENGLRISFHKSQQYINAFITQLTQVNIAKQSVVAILLPRSIESITSMLAILSESYIYCPIDPELPPERINHIISESGCKVIITQKKYVSLFSLNRNKNLTILTTSSLSLEENPKLVKNLQYNQIPEIAFLIYTSGSTGKPKGVLGTTIGLLNRLNWYWRTFPFSPDEVCCHKTPLGFVDSITEVLSAYLKGIPLLIINKNQLIDATMLVKQMKSVAVTRFLIVPSLLQQLITFKDVINVLRQLKYLTISGELLANQLTNSLIQYFPNTTILNFYGSSELSGDVTYKIISKQTIKSKSSVIGQPIDNNDVFILNEKEQLVPIGRQGELYVGGLNLAAGYIHDKKLSCEKFKKIQIFNQLNRLYKTGDICSWNEDNELVFHGRSDSLVKVRGNRIELDEIRYTLMSHPAIKDSTIIVSPTNNELLVAYLVINSSKQVDTDQIIAFLKQKLPYYMLPVKYVYLNKLPLNSNGKIDHKKLHTYLLSHNTIDIEKIKDMNQWFYKVSLEKNMINKCTITSKSVILLFYNDSLISKRIMVWLKTQCKQLIIIKKHYEYEKISDYEYKIAGYLQSDYQCLQKELIASKVPISHVIYTWNLSNKSCKADKKINKSLYYELYKSYESIYANYLPLFNLIQVLTKIYSSLDFKVIAEKLSIEAAPLTSLLHVASQEYKKINATMVIINDQVTFSNKQLVQIFSDSQDLDKSFKKIYFNDETCHTYTLKQISKQKIQKVLNKNTIPIIRTDGVYVITGGIGGIGFSLAKQLINEFPDITLHLVGRSQIPELNSVEKTRLTPYPLPLLKRIHQLASLVQYGHKIFYHSCDLTNFHQTYQTIEKIQYDCKVIHGVIHAAGLMNPSLLNNRTHSDITTQFSSKILSTLILEQLLNFAQLDFFCLCSSTSAIYGGIGSADYAASNQFLDAFAHKKNSQLKKKKVVSINWPTWAKVGMAAEREIPENMKEQYNAHMKLAITPKEGYKIFKAALNLLQTQLVILPYDHKKFYKLNSIFNIEQAIKNLSSISYQYFSRPNLSNQFKLPQRKIEIDIAKIWSRVLKIEQIGIEDNFFDLGGHSLLVAQVVDIINQKLDITISVQNFFENPTIKKIIKHIEKYATNIRN